MNDSIRFSLDHLAHVNYASYANSVPVIRRLHLENHGEEDITDALLTIKTLPEVMTPLEIAIPRLPAKKSVDLGQLETDLAAQFVLSLTEAVKVELNLELTSQGGSAGTQSEFRVHSFDFWPGTEAMPEILASYALPAHPATKNLLVKTGELLGQLTGKTALDGYRSGNPDQVLAQLSAAYSALAAHRLTYLAPPREWASSGKRIRLVDEVLEKGVADGLDLALVMAGVLEAAGLNPILILLETECLIGVWLQEEVYPEIVNYDSTALTKRLARGMNQIAILDPRQAFADPGADFNAALVGGAQRILEADDFILSLDLRRARLAGIVSLPVRVLEAGNYILARPETTDQTEPVLPEELARVDLSGGETEETADRQKIWERKLLDLSLRNGLLNFRPDRAGLPLVVPELGQFVTDLLDEQEFNVLGRPQEWKEDSLPGIQPAAWLELARQEYPSRRLRSSLDAEVMDERTEKLVKGARSTLEETGANALYLGVGFLRWFSRQDPTVPRLAPLILIPVQAQTKGHLAGLLLKAREEEAHFNITLTEMLKKEFGILLSGLDPLPMLGENIDVLKVLSKVRSAILREKQWNVDETAGLGLFSFARFMMWSDLTQNMDQLRGSKLVDSLLAGRLTVPFEAIEQSERFLDEVPENSSVIYPVSSDASQALAVLASVQGRSYVLHGPPGTGKSQTITNIIANALMQDKRVLFVAQKMAALEVVEKRLNDIGIGSFCLELHSNKGRKKAVLDQLENSMKIQRIPKDPGFEAEKQALRDRKTELNEIIRRLYRKDESGWSLYDLITEDGKLAAVDKLVPITAPFPSDHLKDQATALSALAKLGGHAGGPYGHALRPIGDVTYHPRLKERILELDPDLAPVGDALEQLGLSEVLQPRTLDGVLNLTADLRAIADAWVHSPQLLDGDPELRIQSLGAARDALTRARDLRADLLGRFRPQILELDALRLEREHREYEEKNVLGKLFRKNPVEKELGGYLLSGTLPPGEIRLHLDALLTWKQAEEQANRLAAQLPQGLANPADLDGAMAAIRLIRERIPNRERLDDLIALMRIPGSGERLQVCEAALDRVVPTLKELFALTAFVESELTTLPGNYFRKLAASLGQVRSALDGLRDWLMYRQAQTQAVGMGLAPFSDFYHDGHVSARDLIPVFHKSVVHHLLMERLEGEKLLLNTTGAGLEEQARELKERTAEMERLERRELYFHLAGKVPNLVLEKTTSQEIAVLQRALRSGARNLSIRDLFARTDNLLRRIAPCMLMSPLSVAQYLKPEADLFDLVVFDEASQIPTAEAIGALGRAREAIIVGDPKQLPPTSFFMTQTNGGEEPEELQDLDNILEDALALSMPESYLLWHYRSRHESLIAFSNRNFYDGRLYTYPSPDDMVSRVSLRRNDGIYERGGERVNRVEAEAIVEEVIRRIQDPHLVKQSIGIVTFSSVQQTLIDKLITERILADETRSVALSALPEELFVKNLENVQGDERDVILFSVGYGPDKAGRLTMNFGPLNQEGGWRRLNVAVSRARREMVVFTNIDPHTFTVPVSAARGVRELKEFLEFAASGTRTVTLKELRDRSETENLNGLIAEGLRERGWKVETDIGASQFKVDLALVDPRDPQRFLLGVMCGGESVARAGSAYDREVLQHSVLKGLGWETCRVFAMDWLENRERVLDQLDALGHSLLRAEAVLPEAESDATTPAVSALDQVRFYHRHQVPSRKLMMDEFLNVANANAIGREMLAIVEAEGPISRPLLAKRAAVLYQLARVTPKMEAHLERIMNKLRPPMTRSGELPVYWPAAVDPSSWDSYRATLSDDTDRALADIAAPEILSALTAALTEPLGQRQLLRETATRLGYPQMDIEQETFLQGILNVAVLEGRIRSAGQGLLECGDEPFSAQQ